MRTKLLIGACGAVAVTILLGPAQGWAQRWDAPREVGEGAREIRHERREAAREIVTADSPWEVRHEIREGHREITRERFEARREVCAANSTRRTGAGESASATYRDG